MIQLKSQNSNNKILNGSNIDALSSNESIKLIAESIGITNLTDEACKEIIYDLTFTIKSVLLDAEKFCRKSRRKKLNSSDIDFSLKAYSIEPVYGFFSNDQIPFKCTSSSGGNGGGRSIYYLDDHILDLDEIITGNNSNIKLPNDFVINAHWLTVEGVQPSVPENPQLVSRDVQKKEFFEGTMQSKLKEKQIPKQNIGENLVKIKSLVPHDLSLEQQFYFKEITEACVGSDEQKRTEALNSLTIDPGLHQLLPRFILFISEGVRLNIIQSNMAILIYLMRMVKAILENKTIYLEKYLHELLPSILTCLLSKNLCSRPEIDNHYALREYCARLIGQIHKIYGSTLTFLQTRIVKVYLNSIESEKSTFSTLFGAIVGISELGDDAFETLVFPLAKIISERLAKILDGNISNQDKIPADKVKHEITRIISNILKNKSNVSNDEFGYLTNKFGTYLGESVYVQLLKIRSQSTTSLVNRQNTLNYSANQSLKNYQKTNNNYQNMNQNTNKDNLKIKNTPTKSNELETTNSNINQNEMLNETEINVAKCIEKYENNSFHSNEETKKTQENINHGNIKTIENNYKEENLNNINKDHLLINQNNSVEFSNFNKGLTQNENENNISKSSTDQSDDWFF